jgi:hypothetical protein
MPTGVRGYGQGVNDWAGPRLTKGPRLTNRMGLRKLLILGVTGIERALIGAHIKRARFPAIVYPYGPSG